MLQRGVELTRRKTPTIVRQGVHEVLRMKVLVIGGGGREHALVWKLRESPLVEKIWCAPGNGGIAGEVECVAADVADAVGLANMAERLGADLTVVGPELPLVNGVVDEFAKKK